MRRFLPFFLLVAALLMGSCYSATSPKAERYRLAEMENATVHLMCDEGWGSGVILHSDGFRTYVLTAHHVVDDCDVMQIRGKDVEVLAVGDEADLALVSYIGKTNIKTKFSKTIYRGMPVWAVGYPYDTIYDMPLKTVTAGQLAGYDAGWIRFTAPIFSGNSGGPLFDVNGNVVGIVTSAAVVRTYGGAVIRDGQYYGEGVKEIETLLEKAKIPFHFVL